MFLLFTGNTKSDISHICQRTCEWPPQPKTCMYKWKVEWFYTMGEACSNGCGNSTLANEDNVGCHQHPDCIFIDGVSKYVLTVNRQIPGPSIQVGSVHFSLLSKICM